MKKSSYVLLLFGILVLVGTIYLGNKLNPKSLNYKNSVGGQFDPLKPFEIVVEYKKNSPFDAQPYSVMQGRQVIIKVTSDVADELHFHGYDLHTELEPGKQGQITFTADKTGQFDFELENSGTTLGEIDIYPK